MTSRYTTPAVPEHLAHLTPNQRAIMAADRLAAPEVGELAQLSIEEAAIAFGINSRMLQEAMRLVRLASVEIIDAIREGLVTLYLGEKIMKEVPLAEQAGVLTKYRDRRKGMVGTPQKISALDIVHRGHDPRRDRTVMLPIQKQVERAITGIELGAELLEQHADEISAAAKRREYAEILRRVRTRISRAITTLEGDR